MNVLSLQDSIATYISLKYPGVQMKHLVFQTVTKIFYCKFGIDISEFLKLKNLHAKIRSSPSKFSQKGIMKTSSKFTGEHPCQSVIPHFTLRHGGSAANLLHIFRTPFPKNKSGGLLLNIMRHVFPSVSWHVLQPEPESELHNL